MFSTDFDETIRAIERATGAISEAVTQELPEALALPLFWMRYHARDFVLGLTVEKLFQVTATELERLRLEYQFEPLQPIDVPLPLWARTVAHVVARYTVAEPHSNIGIIATQWPGRPVFLDECNAFWTTSSLVAALRRVWPVPTFEEQSQAWQHYGVGVPLRTMASDTE